MSNYLLLRDNKQSGPYSMEELRSKGLKPYDLVWVDGRSAAWRYPSEVEELKSFAPVVEEQPFDRFFKKSSQSSPSSEIITENPVTVKENFSSPVTAKPEPMAASSPAVTPGRRTIYVTMPGIMNARSERVREERVVAFSAVPIPHQDPAVENFSQGPFPNEHRFVEKKPQSNQPLPGGKARPLTIVMSVVALLAAGVLIGLSISGYFRGSDHSSAVREELARSQDHAPSPLSVYTSVASNTGQKTGNQSNGNGIIADPAQTLNPKPGGEATAKKKAMGSKEKLIAMQQQKAIADGSGVAKDSVMAPPVHSRREASYRTDEMANKEEIKNNVVDQVSVNSSKYNTGTFGGISELQLTVNNGSIYPLDLVVVEVRYILANRKVYKTENLYFRGIAAGSVLTQEAPKSPRGIKIQSRIIIINSKELGLSYSGI